MITAAYNNVYVKVKHTAQKNKTEIAVAVSMEHNASISLMDYVTITGEVVSLPEKIDQSKHYKGFSTKDIKVGDTAIFSYYVVGDMAIKNGEHFHKNLVFYKAQQLFVAPIDNIFAVIRNGEIIMVNGYVMLEEFQQSKLVLPSYLKSLISASHSKVLYIGNPKENEIPINIKQGDTVYFNPYTVQKYNIGEKKFCILRQDQILGVEL